MLLPIALFKGLGANVGVLAGFLYNGGICGRLQQHHRLLHQHLLSPSAIDLPTLSSSNSGHSSSLQNQTLPVDCLKSNLETLNSGRTNQGPDKRGRKHIDLWPGMYHSPVTITHVGVLAGSVLFALSFASSYSLYLAEIQEFTNCILHPISKGS